MVVDDAESDCEDFTSGNDKRREMLLELLDHTVHEHLTDGAKNTHHDQMSQEKPVLEDKHKHIDDFQKEARINEGNNRDPLVDLRHHLHGKWLVY